MAISTGLRSKLGYIAEVTYGTTPAIPQLAELPFMQLGVNLTREEYEDNAIRSDRMKRFSLTGNRVVEGSLDVNFCHGHYDPLLESLLQSTFTANILKVGTTRKSFTVEESQQDISQFRVFTGLLVNKADFDIPTSGIVTAKFDVVAKDQSTLTGTTIDTDINYTAASVRVPFADTGVAGFIKEGGSAVGYVTSLTFTIDNAYAQNYALGANVVRDFTTSYADIKGTAQVYFEDAIMYNKFVNGTATSIDLKLDDGTNTVEFFFPNVKYTGATKTITGSSPVVLEMPFAALYDVTALSNIVITRTP
jgi:hypothetical protein